MLVQLEAYLGPDKPETIAERVIETSRAPENLHYAVVLQHRETGNTEIHSVYGTEYIAEQMTQAHTGYEKFGILCLLRATALSEEVLEGAK